MLIAPNPNTEPPAKALATFGVSEKPVGCPITLEMLDPGVIPGEFNSQRAGLAVHPSVRPEPETLAADVCCGRTCRLISRPRILLSIALLSGVTLARATFV